MLGHLRSDRQIGNKASTSEGQVEQRVKTSQGATTQSDKVIEELAG